MTAVAGLAMSGLALGAAVAAPAAAKAPSAKVCETRANVNYKNLLECVTLNGVMEHQQALQAIATANGGNRAAGTAGYEKSVEYVVDTLEAAGWEVSIDEFPFTYVPPGKVTQLSPIVASYENFVFTGTGYGTKTGSVTPVDINITTFDPSTSGCEAGDFSGFPAGNIALIQRGTCEFGVKAVNAQAAGASAVILFNQGNSPARSGVVSGTLFGVNTQPLSIPVVGVSTQAGIALAQPGSSASVQVDAPQSRPQKNVIAELKGENDDNVVMAGAHLDSVQAGPGINDNGSGSSALLELAQQIKKLEPVNTVRLAWWGAEESGLIGSREYVAGLSQAEKDRIALYLNFDMVASPNYIFMVYDSDKSSWPATGVPIPAGSTAIEDLFESLYTRANQPYDDAEYSGRSDYQAFINNGIPSGGLFTGAEVVKTAKQAQIWGGTAGQQYDPCYHLACDTIANLSNTAFDVNSDVIAAAVLTYAYSTESVNGVPGEPVPGGLVLPAPAGPQKTVNLPSGGAGGGGLSHDHDHEHSDVS